MSSTRTLRIVAVYIPLLSGWLSIIGSSSIIYSIWAQRTVKLADPQHRIMLGMSTFDVFYSLCKALTFLLYPSDLGIPTFGNLRTCALQGFFTQFGYAVGMYNLVLSFYYYLTIVKSMKQRDYSRWLEKFCHGTIICLTLGFASTGVAIGLFNPTLALCYIAPYPLSCTATNSCIRFGDTYPIFYEVFAQFWIQVAYVGVIFCNAAIWWCVRKQERTMLRYSITSAQYHQKKQETKHARKVFVQSMLYVCAFLITWTWTTVFHLIGWISGYQALWPILLINAFLPMQGFFNAFIYARPRYQRVKARGEKISFGQALRLVFLPQTSKAGASMVAASVRRSSIEHNDASCQMDLEDGAMDRDDDSRKEADDDDDRDLVVAREQSVTERESSASVQE